MKITIDGRAYQATTAVALIDQIKEMNWAMNEKSGPEDYIAIQRATYRTMIGEDMKMPPGDTEARAIAMFQAISEVGAWKFTKED